MKHEIRVSRHGFTECPSCLAHIRLEEDWARTTCPFCGASLLAATREGPRDLMTVLRTVHVRTGGALAASLLSFGLATGCEDTGLDLSAPPRDAGPTATVRDAGPRDGGASFDAGFVDAGHEDPVDAGFEDASVRDAGDLPPTPLYGKPPPVDGGVSVDATVLDAGDPPVTPHYGLPPSGDGGITRVDAGVDGGIAALYGAAPIDGGS